LTSAVPSAGQPAANGAICDALTPAHISTAFGGPATAKSDSGDTLCTFAAASGTPRILINELTTDSFSVTAQGHSEGIAQTLTIGGHPAVITRENDIVVAEGHNSDEPGILKAYTSGSAAEEQVAVRLLTALIPTFSH